MEAARTQSATAGQIREALERDRAWQAHMGIQANTSLRLLLAALSLALFFFIFCLAAQAARSAMMGIMSVMLPVVVIGWFFGKLAGISAGVLSLPAVICCQALFAPEEWSHFLRHGPALAGTGTCMVVGAVVGLLRDLGLQLKRELYERERDEREIGAHQQRLDAQARELRYKNETLKQNIAERLHRDLELRAAKEELEKLIEHSVSPVIISDGSGVILQANKAFFDMTGYDHDEIIGQGVTAFSVQQEGVYQSTAGETVAIGPEFFQRNRDLIEVFFEKGTISNWSSYYRHKSGKLVPVVQNIVLLFNDRGEPIGSFAILRDVTEQRRAELELVRAKESAEAASKAKSVFLANMSLWRRCWTASSRTMRRRSSEARRRCCRSSTTFWIFPR